jgi:hypothetical protein
LLTSNADRAKGSKSGRGKKRIRIRARGNQSLFRGNFFPSKMPTTYDIDFEFTRV